MSEKTEKITNSLIKLYSDGNSNSEWKLRNKLESINWDKEEKILKRKFTIAKIAHFSLYIFSIILLVILAIKTFKTNQSQVASIVPVAFLLAAFITTSVYKQNSNKYEVFKILRELVEK